jgi:lipoprotein-releasing system permease protein
MFDAFERAVAFRYLRARRGERFGSLIALFSLLGIMLGVATLIIVTSVMNGFRQDLMGRIIGLNGHLAVEPERGRALPDPEAIVARLRAIPGLVQAAPVVEGQVLLSTANGGAGGAQLRGLPAEALAGREVIQRGLRFGDMAAFGAEDGAIMGARLAQRLRLSVGDTFTLLLPQARGGDFTAAPRQRSLTLLATFDVGMPEVDGRSLFVPLATAQALFGLETGATQVEILLDDPTRIAPARAALRAALDGQPVRIVDWQSANSAIYAAVLVERQVMFLILTLIVLVAAFNILSSLTMLVKDKGRDIAILRTMGAGRGAVLRIFLLCGAVIGCGGTLAGLGLGLGIAMNFEGLRGALQALEDTGLFGAELRFLIGLPSVVEARDVAIIAATGFGLSLAATLWPSWRAARIDPAEALRHG